MDKQNKSSEIIEERHNFKVSHHGQKKLSICPVCNKEIKKLTTDCWGNPMCSKCFLESL